MKLFSSLRRILLVNYLLIAILPLVFFGIFSILLISSNIKEEVNNKNHLLARSMAREVNLFLEQTLGILAHLGDTEEELHLRHDDEQTHLESVINRYAVFEMIQILDRDGRVMSTAPFNPDSIDSDMAAQDYHKNAITRDGYYFSHSFISVSSGSPTITISLPFSERMIVGFLNLAGLNRITDNIVIGSGGYAEITDNQGTVIAHPNRRLIDERFNLQSMAIVKKALTGVEGSFRSRDWKTDELISVAIVPLTGWPVIVSQPITEAYALIYRIPLFLGMGIILAIALVVFFALGTRKRILKPVNELIAYTRKVAIGEYTLELQQKSYREADELAQGFRQMSWSIKEREKDLRKSEERYRFLVQNANSIIIRWNTEGKFTFVNEYACTFFGFNEKELIGHTLTDTIIPPGESEGRDLKKMISDIIADPKKFAVNENENITKNGVQKWLQWSNQPIYDYRGELSEILSIGTDITEQKKLEDQLRQAQKMEAVGRLAGGIAHDFNNLLTAINGYAELILLSLDEKDPIRSDLAEIKKAGGRAALLTEQLLAFSRRKILKTSVFNLNNLIANLENMLRPIIGEDIELKAILDENLKSVNADPGSIEQVIINLAVNARDAMADGGKLLIETSTVFLDSRYAREHSEVEPGFYTCLAVTDNGRGIDPEILPNIFEPFFTTKEMNKGTGLGLSTVYGIVKQSGGSITVYSEPHQGTTFKIYLPQVREEAEQSEAATIQLDDHSGSEVILLVEDEELVRNFAVTILEKYGYRVLAAEKGSAALELCKTEGHYLDMVVTDVVMPGMSGKQLAEKLTALYPQIKVLYASGYTENAIVHHGVLDDGIDFIQKPYGAEELLVKIREILNREQPPTGQPAAPEH